VWLGGSRGNSFPDQSTRRTARRVVIDEPGEVDSSTVLLGVLTKSPRHLDTGPSTRRRSPVRFILLSASAVT
jgi:hypothetical protein